MHAVPLQNCDFFELAANEIEWSSLGKGPNPDSQKLRLFPSNQNNRVKAENSQKKKREIKHQNNRWNNSVFLL